MTKKPYQIAEVGDKKFWDYNVKIRGIVYEINVDTKTGRIWICKDPDQEGYGDAKLRHCKKCQGELDKDKNCADCFKEVKL